MKLKALLKRLALHNQETFPYPEDIESYVEEFVPNVLMKSGSLQEAFGITNYDMEILYEEAYNHYNEERYIDSVTAFRWLIFFNSYETKYWMGFAASEQMLKRYERALHAYAMATLLDYENPYPHYHAHECYMQLNQKEEAKKALELANQRFDSQGGI